MSKKNSKGKQESERFAAPEASYLWRYMSLGKFLSLIQNQTLYFSSIARLKRVERHEGRYVHPKNACAAYRAEEKRLDEKCGESSFLPPLTPDQYRASAEEDFLHSLFVNCWHCADHESFAMWKVYALHEGVAIRTTAARLQSSFAPKSKVKMSPVIYRHGGPTSPQLNGLTKEPYFSSEREWRAYILNPPQLEAKHWEDSPIDHINVKVRIVPLIDAIYVSPNCNWLAPVVKRCLDPTGCKAQIILSGV